MSGKLPQRSVFALPPHYFERVKEGASRRWDQLEADPELAGPWHQLFKQVQSPRHILSELLQNADDAGASQAKVIIENDRFVFEHDGQDFVEAHFASLCRFGYSNKRALHTIGFRGIGFKSTFSLGGDSVELYTPTLAVAFKRARFTEPHWIPVESFTRGVTRVEVPISNANLQREVERNLADWIKSPVSLLFFRTVRRLQICDQVVHWESLGPGPLVQSEWMALDGKADDQFLLVRSSEESFPTEALEEIRQERMVSAEDGGEFPPCRVEIVLGAKGRLYVVLPTGVETKLPFACNAPFIQDPARLKIKDPETSTTNHWLLKRAGELAATAMLEWLRNSRLGMPDRAAAYGLLPDVDREATSLEGSSAALVELAFAKVVEDQALLLTEAGEVVVGNAAVSVPQQLLEIWPPEQAIPMLDERSRPALSKDVAVRDREKLVHWNLLDEVTKADLIERLRGRHLPRPSTWRRLLSLWTYIGPDVIGYSCRDPEALRIVPVQGKEVLYAASEVVRLGEKKLLQSDADWGFLSSHLLVLNQNWTRFLADERRERPEKVAEGQSDSDIAFAVLRRIGLQETSDVGAVIDRVASDFFGGEQTTLAGCVQLAQIAAKLGAEVGSAFRYATADKKLHGAQDGVLFDDDGGLELLLPAAMQETQLLHQTYTLKFASCGREEWQRWVSSGRSGLLTLPQLSRSRKSYYSQKSLTEEARNRGLRGELVFPYVTNNLYLEDWDFPAPCWKHWEASAVSNPCIWADLAERVLVQGDTYWSRAVSARPIQVATTGTSRSLTPQELLPSWILRLRLKACLPDTRDQLQVPADLLRRTPETEYLLDVEPFVHGRLDREATRHQLDMLGVRHKPDGPARLLDRLRSLAKAGRAPAHEVEKWYRRLDQLLDTATSAEAQAIKDMFRSEKVIFAHDGTWVTAEGVFLTASEEDVPGAALIRSSVVDLRLWHRVGVAERPSADLAMQWLATLASGSELSSDDARRVRTLLARYPRRIWDEVRHWMNLLGEWVLVDSLSYALSLQSLFRWSHLHEHIKRRTADFQRLAADAVTIDPFSTLPALAGLVEERFTHAPVRDGEKLTASWLNAFGSQLRRIEIVDQAESERIRREAAAIATATWVEVASLEVIPYLDGLPAGTPRLADVLWQDGTLYVSQISKAKLAKRVPEEVGKNLTTDLRSALNYALDRPASDIKAYLEENFTLGPEQAQLLDLLTPHVLHDRELAASPDELIAAELTDDIQSVEEGTELEAIEPPPTSPDVSPPVDDAIVRTRPPSVPTKPPLIERFARAKGYKSDGDGRFFAQDGGWIARSNGGRFPWEQYARSGEVQRYLYPREHCLEREPLQIEADVWSLLDQKPALYSFILLDPNGEPVELTGVRLRTLRDQERITIYPATYRLIYDCDQ